MEALSILQADYALHKAAGFAFFHASRLHVDESVHVELLFGAFGDSRNKAFVDMGCGIGTAGHWVLSRGAKSYIGVNVEPRQVEVARNAGLQISQCSMAQTGLPDNSADVVLFLESLGYVDQRLALREAVRVLRNGGEIWIKDFCLFPGNPVEALQQAWGYKFLDSGDWENLLVPAMFTVTPVEVTVEHYLPIAATLQRPLVRASSILIKVFIWKP